MITLEQIQAESADPLSEEEQLTLELLVQRFPRYRDNRHLYPNLSLKIDTEQQLPTVKTKALRAVLKALSQLPGIVVESQGSDKQPGFFSTDLNWQELAQQVLDVLFKDEVIVLVSGTISLIPKTLSDILPNDYPLVIGGYRRDYDL